MQKQPENHPGDIEAVTARLTQLPGQILKLQEEGVNSWKLIWANCLRGPDKAEKGERMVHL